MARAKQTQLTIQELKSTLVTHKDQLREMLGQTSDIDHYIAGIIEEVDKNPALKTCDPKSILACVRKCALLRLPLGQELAYFVPYAGVCTFQMGYRGLLRLARDEGSILRHIVRSAHEGDLLHDGHGNPPDDGLEPQIKLERHATDRSWDTMTHVYAHFVLPHGQQHLELMSKGEVIDHKNKYVKAGGKDSPWQTNPLAMAKKTVIRRAFAGDQIPISANLRQLVAADEVNQTIVEGEVVQPSDPPADVQDELRQIESGELFEKHEQAS